MPLQSLAKMKCKNEPDVNYQLEHQALSLNAQNIGCIASFEYEENILHYDHVRP